MCILSCMVSRYTLKCRQHSCEANSMAHEITARLHTMDTQADSTGLKSSRNRCGGRTAPASGWYQNGINRSTHASIWILSRIASSPTKAFIRTLDLGSCSFFGIFYSDLSFFPTTKSEGSLSEHLPSVEKTNAHNSKTCTF